ncbi:MAG: hypothetical protein E6H97_13105 [Chloroflexi bacterium]|nr:MAG: hypothetical protein E6H97_13105 [Chloroflexota bacterium]
MAIPHPREIQVAVVNWLDERYPFTKAVDEALYQRVPNFANAFYYCFGGMVFILIVFQLLTGILLALYYVPDASGNPAPAYTSVNFIQNSVYLGWLIRGVHFWGANLLIIMVLLHMARVYWTGAYRAPRELNWIVGVTMLFLILALALTGYLLPWDTKGVRPPLRRPPQLSDGNRRDRSRAVARQSRATEGTRYERRDQERRPWSGYRRTAQRGPDHRG